MYASRAEGTRLYVTAGRIEAEYDWLMDRAEEVFLQLAESQLTGTLFRQILRRIERLAWHPT